MWGLQYGLGLFVTLTGKFPGYGDSPLALVIFEGDKDPRRFYRRTILNSR